VRIAIDAMGGDHAPGAIVDGALVAARHLPAALSLVGRVGAIEAELARHADRDRLDVRVVDAPDVVEMADPAAVVLRRKPRASVRVAAELVAAGEAAALFTAGHTGAAVLASHAAFGMIPGVDRPALATIVPTRTGASVLLDAGASVECRPQHLVQFAVMGTIYARLALRLERPSVGLLSIGTEESKGTELVREAHQLLKLPATSSLRFIGNVEARDVYTGRADVIVCDGFTGNVALKISEGVVATVEELLRAEVARTFTARLGYLLSRRAFRRFRKRVDHSEYGGAPLLGVDAVCVIGHGGSSPHAVRNGVALAHRFAREQFVSRLRAGIEAMPRGAS
jgi:glycerol-3-phosphate acyltransferase PlsX